VPRYVALLRGVSPQNLRMDALRRCVEEAGFADVRTVLSSGNVAFDARRSAEAALELRLEAAMQAQLGRAFHTIVRASDDLRALLATDPYTAHGIGADARRVVTFMRRPVPPRVALPLAADGARVLAMAGREAFTAYIPGPNGPVFMALIQRAFGTDVTTRTWETVTRCAAA